MNSLEFVASTIMFVGILIITDCISLMESEERKKSRDMQMNADEDVTKI